MAIKKSVKAVIISVTALIAAAGAVFGATRLADSGNNDEVQPAYREYSAARGSITVGTSENGTAYVGRSYITFPASAEVEEVYVRVGSEVNEGDRLAKLDIDDIDDFKAQYEKKIQSAKLELEAAQIEKELKLAEAKNTYDLTVNNSANAETEYQLSLTKTEMEIISAENNLADLKAQLEEYEAMLLTYPDDHSVYSEYESTYEAYKDEYNSYEKTLKCYEKELAAAEKEYNDYYTDEIKEEWNELLEMQSAIERARENVESALEALEEAKRTFAMSGNSAMYDSNTGNSASSSEEKALASAQESYDKAVLEYNEAYDSYNSVCQSRYLTIKMRVDNRQSKIDKVKEKIEAYKEMMSEYSEKMSEYKSESDKFNEDYSELYGGLDENGITEKIEKLKSDIETAEYNLEKLLLNESGSVLSAEKDKRTALINASNAESVYDRAVAEINSNIESKQEEYDKLVEEYDEILESIGDGVYVYADCSGAISAVSIEDGSTINSNTNIAAIMDSSEIYVSVSVAEEDISSLSVGQTASVTFSAYENVPFDAEIYSIAVEPSRSSGSVAYDVTVKVNPNDSVKIYEGMTCEITFIQKQTSDVIYVNVQAVRYKGNGISAVLVYDENGNAVEKEVVTGFTDGRYVEIISGIEAGEIVLAESAVSRV